MGIYSKVTRKKRISTPLPLVVLASLAAVAFPQAAAAEAKGSGIGLPEQKVEALLGLQHPRGLNSFVRAVSDPGSPRYREYATVAQLVDRYGAKPKTKQRVLRWLAARGLPGTVTGSGTHVIVPMSPERAARLLPPASGASASSAAVGRAVPAALRGAVSGVSLLSTDPVVEPLAAPATASLKKDEITAADFGSPYRSGLPHTGTSVGCPEGSTGGAPGIPPFTPNQYLTAYGHSALQAQGFKGEGQTVALVETGGFKRSDIVTFAKCYGVAKPPPTKVVPVAYKQPLPPEDETTLDISMLAVGAPNLDKIYVYEGPETFPGIIATAGTALGSPGHQPDVISISLGLCENELKGNMGGRDALDAIFAVAAGAGISVLVSAGDQGSTGCRTAKPNEELTALPTRAVSLPASSPYVTAVGGTNLALTPKNKILAEVVWNDSVEIPWGGGGGGSIITPRTPWWQQGVGYGQGRKVPDIAALADIFPGYALFCTAPSCKPEMHPVYGWLHVGGTSAAAPLTAAGIALINQYAAKQGQAPLGFLNPLLYGLGAKPKSRAGSFNDVTIGNNDIGIALPPEAGGGRPIGCCQAKPGYDWASGWGSLKLPGFAKAAIAAAR